jgi:hypothetical protein
MNSGFAYGGYIIASISLVSCTETYGHHLVIIVYTSITVQEEAFSLPIPRWLNGSDRTHGGCDNFPRREYERGGVRRVLPLDTLA